MKDLEAFNWEYIAAELDAQGHVTLRGLLSDPECNALAKDLLQPSAAADALDLEELKQGRGQLQRLRSGLPGKLALLRASLYARLVDLANRWRAELGEEWRYPAVLEARSGRALSGERLERSTLSRLRIDDHWGLHADAAVEPAFPLRSSLLLSRPGRDFSGGEFVMTEQRPRMQSRPSVLVPEAGDAIIFAANDRPRRGRKGVHRARVKYAVSRIRGGERVALELLLDGAA